MSKLLEGLNAEQRSAVETTEGPVLVLAGAGSGKTRVITVRIAHLLAKGVEPSSVLAVTFTNKAAREMRERVAALVGAERAAQVFIGTFHAFCLNLLREHTAEAGFERGFTICDASDQVSVMRGVLRDLRVADASIQPSALHARISLMKNQSIDAEKFLAGAADEKDELVGRAYQRYDEQLRRSRTLDFDDLLVYAVRLLAKKPMRELYRARFRYVMVDEYQDTNGPQYELVKAIAGGHKNLCVVGDDDQSIYGWRGADVTKILSFERDFKGAKVVKLETNYRSTNQILGAANRVISNNSKRHDKTLRSALGDGAPVAALASSDENEEADAIAREIKELVLKRQAKWSDVAVLFRAAVLARPFETLFRARAVPYVLVGGMSFFDRKEVRDVLAYLKLAVAPEDEVALLRVINCPPRGIGKASIDRALEFAALNGITLAAAFARAGEIAGVPASAAQAVRDFQSLLATATGIDAHLPLARRVERLVDAIGYRAEVERLYPDELTRHTRWNAIGEVVELADLHARRNRNASFATLLQELALTEQDQGDEAEHKRDVVTLMTLHSAKGLEFKRVYLVGVEEGLLPHARSVAEGSVEEERRLMYVGITRAQHNLTLAYTQQRTKFGKSATSMPSRFLFEIKGTPPPKDWRASGHEVPAPKKTTATRAKMPDAREPNSARAGRARRASPTAKRAAPPSETV